MNIPIARNASAFATAWLTIWYVEARRPSLVPLVLAQGYEFNVHNHTIGYKPLYIALHKHHKGSYQRRRQSSD